jgi:hypothetical protein
MKLVVFLCLVLISAGSITAAPQGSTQGNALNRAQTKEAERRLAELGYWTGVLMGDLILVRSPH